jgi:hypothetical protein
MRPLLAAGAARWAPCLAPGMPAPLARHPSPRHPAACGAGTLKPGGRPRAGRPRAAQPGREDLADPPELPGPIHIVAIRQPPGF